MHLLAELACSLTLLKVEPGWASVWTLRLLGPFPDWGWPVQRPSLHNLGEQGTKVVGKGPLAREGRLPTAAHPLGVQKPCRFSPF